MFKLKKLNEKGSIILVFIIVVPFLIAITTYDMYESLTSYQVANFDQQHTEAQEAADAGADYSIEQLAQNSNWPGTGSEFTVHTDSKLKTTFISTVVDNSPNKTINITGKTYFPVNSLTPSRSVSIAVELYPVTNGNYSIVAGVGGLLMSNNSKVVGGSVFVNGELTMSNSAQIGLTTNPVNVQVADEICPTTSPYSGYPRVCNPSEGPEPITISSPTAHIYGQVMATNQSTGTNMSNPGLVPGSPGPQSLPTYDRSAQKSAAIHSLNGDDASCSNKQNVIWPANTKITGDVTLTQSCTVSIKGDVWITGSLTARNTSQLIVDNSVGTSRPNIMVDSINGINLNDSSGVVSNPSGTGAEFYTFYSTNGCSPDCSSVTGIDLVNSRHVSTINLNQSVTAPNSIFYAYWTQVSMANSGSIGAVVGQTISMSNTAAITFGASLGFGTTTWIVKGYRRI